MAKKQEQKNTKRVAEQPRAASESTVAFVFGKENYRLLMTPMYSAKISSASAA